MVQAEEEIRRGPWTEHEDVQLVFYVNLFGDRRWDFIAKVSGLKRTGKSCRLRWVNYLHPGLKRGKMTPHEERLVLELHSTWGNRWSRIARKLPGRTDNEIKNYWRTHMRKKAQEKKRAMSSPSSISINSSSSVSSNAPVEYIPVVETKERSFYDTGGVLAPSYSMDLKAGKKDVQQQEKEASGEKVYSMDDIWKDIDLCETSDTTKPVVSTDHGYGDQKDYGNFSNCQTMASPIWKYCPELMWMMEEEEEEEMGKMFPIIGDQFFASSTLAG